MGAAVGVEVEVRDRRTIAVDLPKLHRRQRVAEATRAAGVARDCMLYIPAHPRAIWARLCPSRGQPRHQRAARKQSNGLRHAAIA
jgi:hypothetical protein